MAVLGLTIAPTQHHALVGQEHGRTIPLPVMLAPDRPPALNSMYNVPDLDP